MTQKTQKQRDRDTNLYPEDSDSVNPQSQNQLSFDEKPDPKKTGYERLKRQMRSLISRPKKWIGQSLHW